MLMPLLRADDYVYAYAAMPLLPVSFSRCGQRFFQRDIDAICRMPRCRLMSCRLPPLTIANAAIFRRLRENEHYAVDARVCCYHAQREKMSGVMSAF